MAIYSCNQCNKTFSHEKNLIRHIHGFHENKILECEVCGFKTSRKDSLKRHKTSKHGNANKLNPISFNCTSSVNEVANNGAYGGQTYPTHMVNSLTQPTPMYNHVQTQTFGDQKTTYIDAGIQTQPEQRDIYADSMVSENGSDSSTTDSQSDTSSVVSYEEMNLNYLLGKLMKVLNVLAHLFQEYKIRKHEWLKLIRKLSKFHKMNTSEKEKFN